MKLIHTSGKELHIENADIIGRKEGKHITFFKKFDSVSGIHGTFYYKNKVWFYKDLGSTNSSFLNGIKLESYKGVKISNGDKIKISEELFTVIIETTKPAQGNPKTTFHENTVSTSTHTQQKTELFSAFYKGKKKFLENKNLANYYPAIVLLGIIITGMTGVLLISTSSWYETQKSTELNRVLNQPSFPKEEETTPPPEIKNDIVEKIESSSKNLGSQYNDSVNYLMDNDLETSWKELEPTAGEGQWLDFFFKKKMNIDKIKIANGFQKDKDSFEKHNRLKTVHVCINDDEEDCQLLTLKDSFGWEEVSIGKEGVSKLRIIIDSVYKGSKWDDTAISEIAFVKGEKPQAEKIEDVSMPKKHSSPKYAYVDVETRLMLRKKPNGSKILSMHNKTKVEIVDDNGPEDTIENKKSNWYKVRYKGKEGWVFGGYLKFPKDSE